MAKTIKMGAPTKVEIQGCVVLADGVELDSYDSRAKTGRAGYQVWDLTDDHLATIRAKLRGIGDEADPMKGFHR
jgi:hypothetical protein